MNKMIYCEVDRGTKSEVSRTLTGDHESRVTDTGGIVIRCVVDMGGGKPSCNVSDGSVTPTLTRGRASVNDIHLVCLLRTDK